MRRGGLVCLFAPVLLPVAAEESLGRLLTTPEERRSVLVHERAVRVEGWLRRPDGQVVLWIDGRRLAVGEAPAAGGRVVAVDGDRVEVERAGRRWRARVGERLTAVDAEGGGR